MILWTLCTITLYTKRRTFGNVMLVTWLVVSTLLFLTNDPSIAD